MLKRWKNIIGISISGFAEIWTKYLQNIYNEARGKIEQQQNTKTWISFGFKFKNQSFSSVRERTLQRKTERVWSAGVRFDLSHSLRIILNPPFERFKSEADKEGKAPTTIACLYTYIPIIRHRHGRLHIFLSWRQILDTLDIGQITISFYWPFQSDQTALITSLYELLCSFSVLTRKVLKTVLLCICGMLGWENDKCVAAYAA